MNAGSSIVIYVWVDYFLGLISMWFFSSVHAHSLGCWLQLWMNNNILRLKVKIFFKIWEIYCSFISSCSLNSKKLGNPAVQWESEIEVSGFERSKKYQFTNGPNFEWDLKSRSQTIWNLGKWQPSYQNHLKSGQKVLILNCQVFKWVGTISIFLLIFFLF